MDGHEENNNHHRRRKHDGKDRRHHDEMRAAATATTSTTTPHKRQRQDIRQRYDTSSESENENTDHPTKRQAKEEDEQQQPHQPRRRTIMSSSYHRAGLQGASDFAKAEAQGKKQRDTDAQRMADKYGHGETIYRRKEDGRGKVSTVRNTADEDESTKQIREMERVVLNTGRVQREQAREQMEYDRKIRESTFARHSDDVDLERIQKNAIREGDPMAAYTTTNVEAIHENPGGRRRRGIGIGNNTGNCTRASRQTQSVQHSTGLSMGWRRSWEWIRR